MASKYTENTDPTNPVSVYDSTQPTFVFSVEISDVLCRNILSHATGFTDLIHLATTCRHWYSQINFLWKSMFKAFYTLAGDRESQKNGDFKLAFWEKLQRERVVIGSDIPGAHVNNPAYYAKDLKTTGTLLYDSPLYLKTVCWIENDVIFKVFPGAYEIIWRIKQGRENGPVPDATLFFVINNKKYEVAEKYEFNPDNYDKWIEVTTGRIEMENGGLIGSKFRKDVFWDGGLWFDCVFIKPLSSQENIQ